MPVSMRASICATADAASSVTAAHRYRCVPEMRPREWPRNSPRASSAITATAVWVAVRDRPAGYAKRRDGVALIRIAPANPTPAASAESFLGLRAPGALTTGRRNRRIDGLRTLFAAVA